MSFYLERRQFVHGALAGGVGAATIGWRPLPAHGDSSLRVAPGVRQLFLDDLGIQRVAGLRRQVNRPQRHPQNPLLRPDDTTWEGGCQVYGTACYDETAQRFKMWYLAGLRDRGLKPLVVHGIERAPHTTLVAYAESKDGLQWTKPDLGQFPIDGDSHNNLLLIGQYNPEGISVLHDPHDRDPQRRWKAFFWDHGSAGWKVVDGKPRAKAGPKDGLWVAFSADGIRWKNYEGNPIMAKYSDTNQVVLRDERSGRYVAFGRFGFGRRIARSVSEDFMTWSEPEMVLECDQHDGPGTQIYGAGIDLYEGVYLGMIWIYREGGDGKIDTQLATSRDGIHWTRVGERATWLELGADESWEGGMVRSVEGIIRRGDQLYIYYCGVHGAHTGPKIKQVVRKHPVMIGLLTQRRDGFVSLDAGATPGHVLTVPFKLPPGRLWLNVDAGQGQVEVEVQDVEGRRLARSEPVNGDRLQTVVSFQQPLPLAGTQIRLMITARQAKLFSYWFS